MDPYMVLIFTAFGLQLEACSAQKKYEVAPARKKKQADKAADVACAKADAAWAAVTAATHVSEG